MSIPKNFDEKIRTTSYRISSPLRVLVTLSIYTAVILELSQLLSILPIDPKEFILVPFVLVSTVPPRLTLLASYGASREGLHENCILRNMHLATKPGGIHKQSVLKRRKKWGS